VLLAKQTTWDAAAARHLLSRALFGYTREDVDFALSMSLDEFVDDYLLKGLPAPSPLGDWVDNYPDRKDGKTNRRNFFSMGYWWFEPIRTQGWSLREKTTLLWHNHFVSEASVVKIPQYMNK